MNVTGRAGKRGWIVCRSKENAILGTVDDMKCGAVKLGKRLKQKRCAYLCPSCCERSVGGTESSTSWSTIAQRAAAGGRQQPGGVGKEENSKGQSRIC